MVAQEEESKPLICHWGKHLSAVGTKEGQPISAVSELQWHFKPPDTTLMQTMAIITISWIWKQTQRQKKRTRICMQPQNRAGLALKGCWLPGTGSDHYSSSPPHTSLSPTSLSSHPLSWLKLVTSYSTLLSSCPSPLPRPVFVISIPISRSGAAPATSSQGLPLLHPTAAGREPELLCPSDLVFQIPRIGKWWKTAPMLPI